MIKFLDLKGINSRYKKEFRDKFEEFILKGKYVLGEEVTLFEQEYAEFCGTQYCIGVSSGLDALHLILEAYIILGTLSKGDEIIVPANTYIATALAVSHMGLKPVLVEPKIDTYNINPELIEKAITEKTKAILGVHLYGKLYDVDDLENIAKKHNLILIEDAAQAHGASYIGGRKAGNVSHAAAFSFYPTKNLGTLGEAGAITTNNGELAAIVEKLRNYGRRAIYKNDYKGFNYRLDELQAAFLRIKLKGLDVENKKRQDLAKFYFNEIQSEKIILPLCNDINQHVFHLFVIRNENRNQLKSYLKENGIETLIHYPIPIHRQIAYKEFNNLKLPITEQIHDEVLSLPLNPLLSFEDIKSIAKAINQFS